MYEGLNVDAPSVIQVSAVLHSEVLTLQGENNLPGNIQGSKLQLLIVKKIVILVQLYFQLQTPLFPTL